VARGVAVNHEELRLPYGEDQLQVRHCGERKRALGARAPTILPQGVNWRWSVDFVSDMLLDNQRFRILAIVMTLRANANALGLAIARQAPVLFPNGVAVGGAMLDGIRRPARLGSPKKKGRPLGRPLQLNACDYAQCTSAQTLRFTA